MWLVVLLVALFTSHFVVGGVLYWQGQKYTQFLLSPGGKRCRRDEVQKSIGAILLRAEARPRLKIDEVVFEGMSSRSVMTEARRLAKDMAKDELRRSGVRAGEFGVREVMRIADALIATDLNIIETAKANLEKRATISQSRDGIFKS